MLNCISVVICTYNRSDMLALALKSLIKQSLVSYPFEIIVVNNASTDGTDEAVKTIQKEYPFVASSIVYEDKQGLGHARNTGLRHARGKYVAFLDDDARADRNWLKTALEFFETLEPSPICVGGPIFPFYTTPRPKWFCEENEIRSWGDHSRHLEIGESFSGSNMIWRKEILEALGGFDVNLGVKGKYLSVGEETAVFQKSWEVFGHPSFFYSPRLLVYHWVAPSKMRVRYQLKRAFVTGQVLGYIHGPRSLQERFRFIARDLLAIFQITGHAVRQRKTYSFTKMWLTQECRRGVVELGRTLATMRIMIRMKQR